MEKIRNAFGALMLLSVFAVGLGFAGTSATQIATGICELYNTVQIVLGAVIFVLIVVAAIVYAAGQIMGAETRARASVWATSMIVGAVIGIIIYVLVPAILGAMLGRAADFSTCPTTS